MSEAEAVGDALHDELVEQFVAITGATEQIARATLEASEWNIDFAVSMHLDTNMSIHEANEAPVIIDPPANAGSASSSNASYNQPSSSRFDDDDVRPPIPPVRQILVEENYSYLPRPTRFNPHFVSDQMRNFQAEAQWREQLANDDPEFDERSIEKRRTLEELFRPPLELMFTGSMESAKDAGSRDNKWLMVNVQDSKEFSCQVLNRDVWSNQAVKTIISEHFIFWQVYKESAEGQRYIQFYPFQRYPYVAILDPRTGELLRSWSTITDSVTFCDLVTEFLTDHASPNGTTGIAPLVAAEAVSSLTNHVNHANNNRDVTMESYLDESEAAQIERAMEESLKTHPGPSNIATHALDEDSDDLETFQPSDDDDIGEVAATSNNVKPAAVASTATTVPKSVETEMTGDAMDKSEIEDKDWRKYLGTDSVVFEIMLRFPDGKRETVSMPSDSKIKALFLYLASQGYSLKEYDVFTNYPRKNFHDVPTDDSLANAGLTPRETLFVQHKT